MQVTPHVAQHTTHRVSAIDGRTTRHPGYTVSQQKRKRVEELFGWLKTVGLLRKVNLRGVPRVGWLFTVAATVYNLVRMRNLVEAAACRVAHNGPPQWDIPLTDERHRLVRWDLVRIGSVNPGFSAAS